MKSKIITFLLFIFFISGISIFYFSNKNNMFEYSLYNKNTQKIHKAIMLTLSDSDTYKGKEYETYDIGLSVNTGKKNEIICLIVSVENLSNGLKGGRCVDIKSQNTVYIWKENKYHSYTKEILQIIEERGAKKHINPFYLEVGNKFN